jgi:hypothetical protein
VVAKVAGTGAVEVVAVAAVVRVAGVIKVSKQPSSSHNDDAKKRPKE